MDDMMIVLVDVVLLIRISSCLPACLPAARSLSFEALFQKQNKEIPFVALLLSALQDMLVGWHSCDNLLLL
jgi:hypothetical protein